MKQLISVLLASSIVMLTGCAPINTQFSCNETAGDKCLSIEEVHAMTELTDKDVSSVEKCTTCDNKKAIWFAPWRDKNGQLHQADVSFVG